MNRRRGQNRRPSHAETLEQRTLLTVNTLFTQGDLTIVSDNADDIVIGSDSMTGLVTLDVNGVADPAFPIILANQVESLLIIGSDSENTIDLSGITSTAFSFMDTNGGLTIEVDAGNGDDTLVGSPDIAATLRGGDGNDIITSTAPADTIFAGDGADTVTGGDGNDSIIAGDGDDVVTGDAGDDVISGDNGADSISGGDGADAVTAGDGPDTVAGDAGNDTLDGQSGTDLINGNDGDDSLIGGPGNDTVFGDAGDDLIDGQANDDSLSGNDGNDSIFGANGRDTIAGNSGDDFLQGDLGNDSITGSDGADSVFGGGGHDAIDGGDNDDMLFGNGGHDTISGGGGADVLTGGAGDDVLDTLVVFMSIDDVLTIPEGDAGTTTATFTITLSAASTRTITVEVSTVDQTATAGTDFTGITNQLVTFTPGQTVQTVEVSIIGDTAIEQEEFFEVVLTNVSNASILDGIGQGNIQDNDNPGPTSTIGLNFQGTDSTQIGFNPPDTMGAVGPDHIVELLNGRFAVYDKLTGAEITSSSSDQFVTANGGVIPTGESVFDPRIVYDHDSGRWFASFIDALTPANTIYVMVSTTSDPTMPWQTVQFIGDTVGNNRFNDYETLAVDADGVYLGTNNFVNSGGFDVSLYSIPKADLLAATPTIANLSRFENLNAGTFGSTPQPALDFGPSDGVAAFFSASGSGRLTRTDIIGATGPGATLGTPIDITVPAYLPAPPGDQPGGVTPLENVTPRIVGNVVEVGSSFWMTHAVLDMGTGNSAIRWYEIDENTNALLQTGTIVDPALDFLDPSIAVNDTGSVVIGYTGTGPAQSPSSYASIGQTTAGVTAFTPPTLLQQGTGTRVSGGRNRWGDYSATVLDPTNPAAFWTFQQLTIGNNDFAIQITNVNIGAPPPPTPMPPPGTTGLGDTIDGGEGNDTVLAGTGDDQIVGGLGNDMINGSSGSDTIYGGGGDDVIDGGLDNDILLGQGGHDSIFGNGGDDELIWRGAGDGHDTVDGGDGSDLLNVRLNSTGNSITIGQDLSALTVSESAFSVRVESDGIQLSTETVNVNGRLGDDRLTLTDVNNVGATVLSLNGDDGNDILSAAGAQLGNVILALNGGNGFDTITGTAHGDSINGGDGDDSINGDMGNDTLTGGLGDDILNGNDGDDSIDGGEGNDTLGGGAGNDFLDGSFGNDSLDGDDGDDTLIGGFGDDNLLGDFGNDSIEGGSGLDTLLGGAGNDTLDGGRNEDMLLAHSGDDVIRGDHGDDTIRGHNGNDTIDGGDGADVIFGLDGNDGIVAGDGNDMVDGGLGNDTILGGDGEDVLLGGGGRDLIFGQDGNDTIGGNAGQDTLVGGTGLNQIAEPAEQNEQFVLSAALLASLDANI